MTSSIMDIVILVTDASSYIKTEQDQKWRQSQNHRRLPQAPHKPSLHSRLVNGKFPYFVSSVLWSVKAGLEGEPKGLFTRDTFGEKCAVFVIPLELRVQRNLFLLSEFPEPITNLAEIWIDCLYYHECMPSGYPCYWARSIQMCKPTNTSMTHYRARLITHRCYTR